MSGIEGKVLVITGASSGIGEATALLLTERGAKAVLGARGSDRLEALANRIEAGGGEVVYAPTNVKRREDLPNLVRLAVDSYGKVDVLVSNAGVAPISLLDEIRVEDWEEMIDVNLKGVLYGIAAALPVFRSQDWDFAGICEHESCGFHDKSRSQISNQRPDEQDADSASGDRPRHCIRDRAAA